MAAPTAPTSTVSISGTECDLTGLAAGSYVYEAVYSGNAAVLTSTSGQFSFEVTAAPPPPPDPDPSTTTLSRSPSGSIILGDEVVLTATVSAPSGYDSGATIDFNAVSGGGPDCDGVSVSTSGTTCTLSNLPLGTYTYEAVYSGNADVLGSTSNQVTFEVSETPDTTLEASDVTLNYTTFYPAKDSYKDKLTISGTREEPITVTIKIYSSSGHKVLTKVLALGDGEYAYLWSGRTSSGKILASGKYKVVQTLKDLAGNTLVVTKYSTLSHKKLVTKTKTITKKGRSIAAATGIVYAYGSSGAKIDARMEPVGVGYGFTIPKATKYTSISFKIYAKGPKTAPSSAIGMQNFDACPYVAHSWSVDCFYWAKSIGGGGTKWYSTTGGTASHSGTHVRGIVVAGSGVYYVYKVRVKVVYKVLR